MTTPARRLFARGSFLESSRVADILRTESIGGALVMIAALIAFIWANSPWSSSYEALGDLRVGPSSLHLDLTLATWAADGLLAIFFFVAGLELKREFVAGDLRDPRRAALPVAAALGGMVAPALIFVTVNLEHGRPRRLGSADGDRHRVRRRGARGDQHPPAQRAAHLPAHARGRRRPARDHRDRGVLHRRPPAVVPVAGPRPRRAVRCARAAPDRNPLLLVPLALVAWALVHESGVHATVAGVLLGFTVPVLDRHRPDAEGLAEHLEHLVRPISAGIAVPVFAFFAAGVDVGGWSGLGDALGDPVALGVIAGLVLGKPIGITAATWLVHTFTRADLDDELAWTDVVGMAMLAGIGFTVSLLIGELAYAPESPAAEHVKVGVIVGSLVAAVLAGAGTASAQPGLPTAVRARGTRGRPQLGSVIRSGNSSESRLATVIAPIIGALAPFPSTTATSGLRLPAMSAAISIALSSGSIDHQLRAVCRGGVRRQSCRRARRTCGRRTPRRPPAPGWGRPGCSAGSRDAAPATPGGSQPGARARRPRRGRAGRARSATVPRRPPAVSKRTVGYGAARSRAFTSSTVLATAPGRVSR